MIVFSLGYVLKIICLVLATIVPLLVSVALFTLAERKVMAAMQRRKGPNVVGFWGLLQPFADGLKLILKENIIPTRSRRFIFLISPVSTLALSFTSWSVIPFSNESVIADIDLTLLFLLGIGSLNAYGVVLAGWASNSRYAFLGGLRAAAQMVSYEIILGLVAVNIVGLAGTLNLTQIVFAQAVYDSFFIYLVPLSVIFFITILAETNRAPFDLPEAEAELVAGFNVEYASIVFAMFFLGEYSNIILMSTLFVILFFGGWNVPYLISKLCTFIDSFTSETNIVYHVSPALDNIFFVLKIGLVCFAFIWVRSSMPRFRYDQLMDACWKSLMPLVLSYIFIISGYFYY